MNDPDGADPDWSRRTLLGSLGATAVTLSGCLGDDDDAAPDDSGPDTGPGEDDPNGEGEDEAENGDEDADGSEGEDEDETDPAELEDRARTFVERIVDGDVKAAYELTGEEFASEVPPEELAALWETEFDEAGPFQGFRSVEYRGENEAGRDVVVAYGWFPEIEVELQFGFENGAIGGFLFFPSAEWTPPAYVDQAAFTESEVSLDGPGACELPGTLTVPDDEGTEGVPGVVLVHGSGDQDRDQTVGPNRTFRELAEGLASRGVATVRYDKRTIVCAVDRTTATVDDIVTDDAVRAVERLQQDDRISEVYVAGHSLGGRLAPRVAARSGADGLVLLAPAAEPAYDAIVRQQRHVLELDGELTDREEDALAEVERLADRIERLEIDDDEVLEIADGRGRPFWETLQAVDGPGQAAELDVPTLLVQGGRDYLVTVTDDLPRWEAAIGDDPDTTIEVLDDLNHRFQPGDRPADPNEWVQAENPVDERVITQVAEFVHGEGDQRE